MDERIGRLIAELDALGLRERTIVIVQSDHGHSTEERAFFGGGSAGDLSRGQVQPVRGRHPRAGDRQLAGSPAGERRSAARSAHGCDWLPTIAELCGVPLPKVHARRQEPGPR